MDGIQKAELKQIVKIGCAKNMMTMGELALKLGKAQCSISNSLHKSKTTHLSKAQDMLEALNAKMIVRFEDGQEYELKKNER
jgi:flagellin-specific chaperone FliS